MLAAALFAYAAPPRAQVPDTAPVRPRVFVLTDIENEPDDAMSMVRFLTYANHFDIEGLVATTSIHQRVTSPPGASARSSTRTDRCATTWNGTSRAFRRRAPAGRISEGLPAYGMDGVGEGKDSPGSEALIAAVDRDDPRPLWVPVWGGPNVLAQALWKVRATRPAAALDRFVAKFRVYTISDQDDSGPWHPREFPNLFYITSPGFNAGAGATITPRGAGSAVTTSMGDSSAPTSPW